MEITDITFIKTLYGNAIYIVGMETETGRNLFQRAIPASLESDADYLAALKIVMFREWDAEQAAQEPQVI